MNYSRRAAVTVTGGKWQADGGKSLNKNEANNSNNNNNDEIMKETLYTVQSTYILTGKIEI